MNEGSAFEVRAKALGASIMGGANLIVRAQTFYRREPQRESTQRGAEEIQAFLNQSLILQQRFLHGARGRPLKMNASYTRSDSP